MTQEGEVERVALTEAWLVEALCDIDPMCGRADCEYTARRLLPRILAALTPTEPPVAGTGMVDDKAVDRAARYLRETQQAGKKLTPWESTPMATKRKWLDLARGTLIAASEAQP